MYETHLQHGYILKDIAEYIGIDYTIVSKAIKKPRGKRSLLAWLRNDGKMSSQDIRLPPSVLASPYGSSLIDI